MGGGSSTSYQFITETSKLKIAPNNTLDWVATGSNCRPPMKPEGYEVIAPIGKGKFGLVHLVKALPSNKYLAIKYIPKQIIFDCEANNRIQNELDILMKVKHPFIMPCVGAFDVS